MCVTIPFPKRQEKHTTKASWDSIGCFFGYHIRRDFSPDPGKDFLHTDVKYLACRWRYLAPRGHWHARRERRITFHNNNNRLRTERHPQTQRGYQLVTRLSCLTIDSYIRQKRLEPDMTKVANHLHLSLLESFSFTKAPFQFNNAINTWESKFLEHLHWRVRASIDCKSRQGNINNGHVHCSNHQ